MAKIQFHLCTPHTIRLCSINAILLNTLFIPTFTNLFSVLFTQLAVMWAQIYNKSNSFLFHLLICLEKHCATRQLQVAKEELGTIMEGINYRYIVSYYYMYYLHCLI